MDNSKEFLDGFPCNNKLLVSHLAINVASIHSGIWKELFDDFWVHISTRIQQLHPCPLLEHISNASVLKSLHSNNSFHNDYGSFVAIVIIHIYLNGLEVVRVYARMLGGFLGSRMLGGRHLHKETHKNNNKKLQKHKNKT